MLAMIFTAPTALLAGIDLDAEDTFEAPLPPRSELERGGGSGPRAHACSKRATVSTCAV